MPWQPPNLTVKWGSYTKPDAAEQKQLVELVNLAKTAGVITLRSAVEKLRPVFPFESAEAVLEALEEEAESAMAREQEKLEHEAATLHSMADGTAPPNRPIPGRGGAGARPKPAKDAGGGGGSAAPAKTAKG